MLLGRWMLKTKELLGLVASMALRCDDCIKHHLEKRTSWGETRRDV